MLTRTDVRTVTCPACHAEPGTLCVYGDRKYRVSCHAERWNLKKVSVMLKQAKSPKKATQLTRSRKVIKPKTIRSGKKAGGAKPSDTAHFGTAKDEVF